MMTIDDQIRALVPLSATQIAQLAGYAQIKQFNDYRKKGRVMNPARLEKLAIRLEQMAGKVRDMKDEP